MTPRVLVVFGSAQPDARLDRLLSRARASLDRAGAEVVDQRLWELDLPIMRVGDEAQGAHPAVRRVREEAARADAFLLGTPEYHGTMSGVLKNWFDYLYGELAGKLAGVVATTGGGTGDLSITSVKRTFAWCHGFTLPFHCAADRSAFSDGELSDPKVIERVDRMAHDLVRYAKVIRPAFEAVRGLPGVESGVAGLHPRPEPSA